MEQGHLASGPVGFTSSPVNSSNRGVGGAWANKDVVLASPDFEPQPGARACALVATAVGLARQEQADRHVAMPGIVAVEGDAATLDELLTVRRESGSPGRVPRRERVRQT